MRRIASLAALALLPLTACGSTSGPTGSGAISCTWTPGNPAARAVHEPAATVDGHDHTATVRTSVGTLHIALTGAATPCTVASFVSLAQQGFYDNTSCHREGNVFLQCGDPTGMGTGGPGYTIPDEVTGSETYTAGTLAMANTGAPNSGGSQFFMVFGDFPLSPTYTVFGHLDAASVALLKKAARTGNDGVNGDGTGHPRTPVTFEKVTIS